jgi:glycosyltransferase involved in cell wall biosynthesis
MKILLLNRFDIYTIPGTIRMVELSLQFVRKGHQVTLCYYPNEERRKYLPLIRQSDPEGVRVVKLPGSKTDFFKNLQTIRNLARESDIIHFQKCFPETALPALWAAYLEKKPIHYDWDDLEIAFVPQWTRSKGIYNLVGTYEKWLPAMVDSVSYSTSYVKQMAMERGGQEDRMFWAPVGGDLERFNPQRTGAALKEKLGNQYRYIVYIGQLEEGSYAELFIRAAGDVVNQYPDIKFIVAGGGHRLPDLQTLAQSLGLQDKVIFTNYVPHSDIPDYVGLAEICVACFEDNELTRCKSPLKIAEYLCAGKPIVASKVGDIPEMVKDAGVVVPPGDWQSLGKALLELLAQPDKLSAMKTAARRQAEQFYNWSVLADRFLENYQKVISSSRRDRE